MQALQHHSPLEGESQKPSRQAKADAVGGWTPSHQTAARDPHAPVPAQPNLYPETSPKKSLDVRQMNFIW